MSVFVGDTGGVGLGTESTPGTGVAAGGWLNARPGGAAGKQGTLDEADHLGATQPKARTRGAWAGGPVPLYFNYSNPTAQAALLEHAFGEETSGVSPWVYSIKDPTDVGAQSLHIDRGGYVDRLLGAKCTMLSWNFGPGYLEMDTEWLAMSVDHPSPATITKPSTSLIPHSNDLSVFSVGGDSLAAKIMAGTVKMDIPHTGEERLFLGSQAAGEPQRKGGRVISATFELELEDTPVDVNAKKALWEANTNLGTIIITLTNGTQAVTWTLAECEGVSGPPNLDHGTAIWPLEVRASDLDLTVTTV